MGNTLNRLKNIMLCNVRKFLDSNDKNQNEIENYIRKFEAEEGKLRAQYDSLKAEMKRRKRQLNECEDEILKMDRYIKKSIENGNRSDAVVFQEKREAYADEKADLEKAYEISKIAANKMEEAEKKIASDIKILNSRLNDLKKQQMEINMNNDKNSIHEKLNKLEDEVNSKAAEAEGLREINEYLSENSSEDCDLDKLFEELENDNK